MSVSSVAEANPLGDAIARLRRRVPAPFFLQIGGFDGESFDPLRASIVAHDLAGLIVEPIPQYFEKLQALYFGSEKVLTANYAVGEEDGTRTLWRFDPTAVARGLLAPHFAGISSFVMDDLLSDQGVLGRSSPNAETTAALRRLVQPVPVACRTIDTLMREFGIGRVDILQIDTEGYDFTILKLFDLVRYRPSIIQYEHQHLSPADAAAARNMLMGYGYRLTVQQYDTLAELEILTPHVNIRGLRTLARTLLDNGQGAAALPLVEHLHSLAPNDGPIRQLLAQAQEADGRIVEAMATVAELQGRVPDENIGGILQSLKLRGFEHFNAHLTAGRLQQAACYMSGLATLFHRHAQIQDTAFRINRTLGRTRLAIYYAISALALDDANEVARSFLKDARHNPATADIEIALRVERGLSPRRGLQPLYQLRDLHFAASAILCHPLTPQRRVTLEHVLDTAASLKIEGITDSKWELWEHFYRLILKAVDLKALDAPTPEPAEQPMSLISAGGAPLTWQDVRDLARRGGARMVFFAAGDEVYVQKFARWYALSILKYADVPCLVIVHVIGAGNRLAGIVKALNIADERLVFAGDDFDAAAVTTTCYDSPGYGIHAKPVAHYQSVRFQRLPALLSQLQLPVCVSDIDLLLQRGVADMLETHAAADVVINENLYGLSAADRITANLLFVRPTATGLRFARFVAESLNRALAGPAVVRWVDQVVLLMARHHLQAAGEGRINLFDADRDINNTIFNRYEQNPYRFLSLYQWFDMASLEAFGLEKAHAGA